MEFAWIRWYGDDPDINSGWAARRLHRVGFVPQLSSEEHPNASPAFEFLGPAYIIRGAHIVPAFAYGFDPDSLPPSPTARRDDEEDQDYSYYYVMPYVLRSIFMSLIA